MRSFPHRVSCRFLSVLLVPIAGVAFAQSDFANWETPHVHPLELTPSRETLIAANTADDRIEIYDVTGGGLSRVRSIPVGVNPVSVRARTETEVWVINALSDSISIVDLPSGRVTRTINTGDCPADVVFAGASPQRAYVTVAGLNQVRVWDTSNLSAAPTILAIQGQRPKSLAVSPDGTRVYAAIFESGNLTTMVRVQDVSNPAGPYAGRNPPPNAGPFFSPAVRAGLPPAPPVSMIVRRNAAGQWFDDNNGNWSSFVTWNLHDNDVAMIDTSTLAVAYAKSLMTTVMALGVRADGVVTAVGTEAANETRFVQNVRSIFVRSVLGSFDPASPGVVTTADLNPHLDYAARSTSAEVRALSIGDPRGIVWSSDGVGYVAGMGSNNVIVIDSAGTRLGDIDVDEGPTGLALDEPRGRLYVLSKFAARVSIIDTGSLALVRRVRFFDPTPAAISLGRPLLFDTHATSGLGQVSCASCHIDGRSDFLAWDLGDPSGTLVAVNEPCRQGPGNCDPWHPMKGPMVTQSLQGIIGDEPFHWRGDKTDLAAFAPAFVDLQGADAQPDAAQMQLLQDFIATIKYPPNPNRNLNGSLSTSVPTSTGVNGNAVNGLNLFNALPVLPGGATCVSCHTLPTGTSNTIDDPPAFPQSLKVVQLRGMNEKAGLSFTSANNAKGFGFNHDSSADTLNAVMGPPFQFAPGPPGQQQRRDIEAFVLSLSNDTHAAVGQQVTLDGTNNGAANVATFFNTIIPLANAGTVGLIAKGRVAGLARGYSYDPAIAAMRSDRAAETISITALRNAAVLGGEITFTVVYSGTQVRAGVDRDRDGYFDRDEIERCGDPDNTAVHPGGISPCDANCDGTTNAFDVQFFLDLVTGARTARCSACAGDVNGNGTVNPFDIQGFVNCLGG